MKHPAPSVTRSLPTCGLEPALARLSSVLRLLWTCLFLLPLVPAAAQSVSIQDASFDARYISPGSWNTTLTPWLETNGPGNSNGFVENISGFSADGSNHLGMNLSHSVWQDLGVTYQANTRYTLTVAVGNRSGVTSSANQSRYMLGDSAGGIYATGSHNASTVAAGTFADAPALVFETGSSSSAIGKTIRVLLQASGTGRSHFDKIRLTAVPTLLPVATTGAASGVTDSTATLAGTVNANGQSASVSFEYGLSTAYGQTLSATPSSVSGTTATSVTAELSNLAPSTTYHYRLVVTAGAATVRGADRSFTTAPASALGLSPSSFSLGVRSGEVATLGMTVENTGAGAGSWALEVVDANGLPDSIAGALKAIDASGTALNGPLPNRYDFTGGETGTSISNGAMPNDNSLFSGGSQLNTSAGGPLAYSNGVVTTAAAMGKDGSYFTRKLPGLFVFGCEINGPSWFEVGGSIVYGSGTRQTSEFSIVRNGKRWSAFVAKTPEYWRTINHLILVDQEGLTATTGTYSTDQKHQISGLTGKRRVFYMLYVTSTTTIQPDSVFEQLAGRLLDAIPPPYGSILSVSPSSGTTVAGGSTPVTLTANATGVVPGTYPLVMRVKKSTAEIAHSENGSLVVTSPRLTVPESVVRTVPVGLAPFVMQVPLTTAEALPQPWSASVVGSPGWLSVETPAGNTPDSLKLKFTPGALAAGTYRASVRVTSGSAVFEIPVMLVADPLSIRKLLPDPARPLVYAVNQNGKAAGQVLEIDPLTKQIKRTVTVGKEPSDLDLTADGSRLVVMNTSDPSLSIVDLATFTVSETIPLSEFSNRNEEFGGHVKCGNGSIVYYVDEQWGPRLRVFDTATRTVLQTLGSQSGSSPNTGNDHGYGDINVTPSRDFLFGWGQNGDSSGSTGTHLVRFAIGADGKLSGFATSDSYNSPNFARQPFDTPVMVTRDAARLIIKDRVVDKTHLDSHPIIYPDEIYSTTPGGEVTVGSTAIYAGEGGEILHTLATSSTVQAVLPDYSYLVYFNTTAKTIGWLDLPATLGTTRLGLQVSPADGATVIQPSRLKWMPVTGIMSYQVYMGTNRSEVEAATTASPLYLGLSNGNEMALATPPALGQTYYWRVVPVDAAGTPAGTGITYTFTVSNLTLSRSSISAETVQGVGSHLETIQLASASPQSWTATESVTWIKSVTPSGTTPGTLTVEMDATGLAAGTYQGSVVLDSAGARITIPVSLRVYAANFVISEADLDLPYIYLVSQADVNSTSQPSFLLRVNTATDKIESAVPCGSGVTDLAVHYSDNRIYLTNWKTGILRAFDRATFAQVQTYQFAPVGSTGSGGVSIWKISAGKAGRLIIEESDQWVDICLINTANGAVLATRSTEYTGDGEADPLGRYYYHSETLTTSDSFTRYDLSADTFAPVQPSGTAQAGTVVMIPDGSKVAAGANIFNPQMVLQYALPANVLTATLHGDLLFTSDKAYNGNSGLQIATLPTTATVTSVSGDQKKLYQFPANSATFRVTNLSTIAPVPSRALTPTIPNGSTVIGTNQELGWSIEPLALSFDVYFGTSAAAVTDATKTSPEFLGNTTGTKWTGTQPALDLGTTYYWRVDVTTFSGSSKGAVWSFRIAPLAIAPNSLSVVLPAGAPSETRALQVTGTAGATWTASTTTAWLALSATGGTAPGTQNLTIKPAGLAAGIYQGSVRFQSGGESWELPVKLEIIAPNYILARADLELPRIYAISQAAGGTDDRAFLVMFDTATNQVAKVVPVGRSVTSLSVHYQENRIYLTNWASGVLRALDRTTLEEVEIYQFAPAGQMGYSNGDAYVVAAGRSGRIMVEEWDQWVDCWLVDTANGTKLATFSTREGGGLFEPTGRYYFHGENNSSGAVLKKLDTDGDKITQLATARVDAFSYYGSRLVAMSGDGSRIFWNGGVFDTGLNVLLTLNEEVVESTYHGELLFTKTKAINGTSGQTLSTLPVNTKVQAVSGDQKKLFQFNGAAITVVSLSSIATLPPRGLIPGIPNGSVVIGSSQELSWSLEAAALSYDVYFGTSAAAVTGATKTSPEYLGNAIGTKWTGSLPALSPGSTYYWRVDTNGFSSAVKGATWSFAIAVVDVVPRTVRLASPAGAPVPRQSLAMSAAKATAWTASTTTPWITLRTNSGTTPGSLEYDINTTGLTVGTKTGSITIQSSGQTFTVPVELSIVTLNVTKLLNHPNKAVVYGINTALAGEGFSHLLEINAATAAIQRTIPIGFAPTDAALDPATGKLLIANNGYSQSKVIDVDNWTELPSLPLGEKAKYIEVVSGGRLAVLSGDSSGGVALRNGTTGAALGNLNEYYNGNIAVPPSGDLLYLAGSGSSGSNLKRYRIDAAGFTLEATGPQINYGSANLVMSADGKRLFWQGRALDENLNILSVMPSSAEIYSTNSTGALAIGESAIWWSDSGTPLATLPFASQVAAVSMGDAYLVRFNATSRALTSTAISTWTDLPGPSPRPGQILEASPQRFSWTPVVGATGYRVFIAADAAALQAMTAPSAAVATAYYDPATPLTFGRSYSWRVDAVTGSGTVTGKVQSFSIRFPQGPTFAEARSDSSASALSLADGKVLLGWASYGSASQLFDFNSATGATTAVQSFSNKDYNNYYYDSSVSVDRKVVAIGARTRANPADGGGNVLAFRPGTSGFWEQSALLAPPSPVANEGFGKGIATSGNLMLAGTASSYNTVGRVVAYLAEPAVVQTQVFSASDGVANDGFGSYIVMDGNRAIISAPGSGGFYNRIPCLYAFTRSTSTGLWTQTQKITIPGASASSSGGTSLALHGSTMVVRASASSIAVFNETGTNQWTHSVTINSSSVSGSSYFGTSLALQGDLLFVGDSAASYLGTSGGAVYVFRRSGTAWTPGPVITPTGTRSGFGTSLAAREGWLFVAGSTANRPASVFRIDPSPNRIPRFRDGVPEQMVAGRPFSIPLTAEDEDGNKGLVITKLQGPSWLALADNGDGNAVLSGTPVGAPGTTVDAQFEVRDAAGAKSWWSTRITLLAPTDLPVLTQEPVGTDLGVGQELTLRAAVSGIGPFQWQWYFNGNPIPGATLGTLVIGEVTPANAGRYQVRVSNAAGEDASSVAVLTVHEASRYAGDWPTFGGSPSHTGRHPAAFGVTQFVPAWSQTLQSGSSLNRAAIADGRAVVVPSGSSATGLAAKAVDLQTGKILWSFPFASSYSSNPPSIHNGRVYFQRGSGTSDTPRLFCLNAATGSQIWASAFAAQSEGYEAPAISDQGVYVNGGTFGGMYGFNFDGSQKFFTSLAQYSGWTPTISMERVFSCAGSKFTEHNPQDGSEVWSLTVKAGTTVVAIQGGAAVMAGSGLTCVDLPTRSIRWTTTGTTSGRAATGDGRAFVIQGNAVRSYALADGTPGVVYQTTAPAYSYGSELLDQPIIFNDRLAISNSSKTWIFSLADGQLLQTLDAGGRLSYSNSYLLMAGTDGVLRAFRAVHDNANLASLSLSAAPLDPRFDKDVDSYTATVPHEVTQTTVTPVLEQPDAVVTVNGTPVPGGAASQPVDLVVGNNPITVTVTAEDGVTARTYRVVASRLPQEFYFASESDVPLTAERLTLGDWPASIRLGFAPRPGTVLTMIRNTGLPWIRGRFSNLAQGQRVSLPFGGKSHDFTVDYHGGTGNDLVLQWADTTLAAWGANGSGQLGDGTAQRRLLPTTVAEGSALDGRTIKSVSAGYLHSLALTTDGAVAVWGGNTHGQAGNGGSANVPVPAVPDPAGVLSGRTVVAVAAGSFHSLALCSDGSIAAWGYNNHGQLGDGTRTLRRVPVLVPAAGALAGKRVVAVAAGAYQSFALCDDGTVASWGYNDEGELGDGSTTGSAVPVAVKADGVLAGRKVVALAAGQYHTLGLCADGGVVAWGYNNRGQIGNSTSANALVPVDLRAGGALTGRSVVAIAAGGYHSMALGGDGKLAAWGQNHRGQLGADTPAYASDPLLTELTSLPPSGIACGANHNLIRFPDGSVELWGENANGQLGDGTLVNRAMAGDADFSGVPGSSVVMFAVSGPSALHNLAVIATTSGASRFAGSTMGDPDKDGVPNLIEYAFGLDPDSAASCMLPQPRMENGVFVVSFESPADVSGITYGAEWSETLAPGSWLPLTDSGSGRTHRFAVPPAAAGRAFIRLKVTSAP